MMNLEKAKQILAEQKDGTNRYPEHIITEALRFTGDLPSGTPKPAQADADTGVEGLGLGLRKEFEQERHIGALRRDRSRTQDFV